MNKKKTSMKEASLYIYLIMNYLQFLFKAIEQEFEKKYDICRLVRKNC